MLGLPKLLFRTFILSVIIGIAVTSVWYTIAHKQDGPDYSKVLETISVGALFLNAIMAVMSLPVLFLASPEIRKNKAMKPLLYFVGTVVLIVAIIVTRDSSTTRTFYLLLAGIYTVIHTLYYFRSVNRIV